MEKYKLIMRIIATVIMIIAITLSNITDSNLPILILMVLGVSAAEAASELYLESEMEIDKLYSELIKEEKEKWIR